VDTLYHVSPTPGLKVLKPNLTKYFGKPKQVCLTACLPMALLYGIKHFEYTYGYTRAGEIYYEDRRRADMEPTAIPNEFVTEEEVPVEEERPIPDVLVALLEQERLGVLKIVRWDEMSGDRRRWIICTAAETIQEKGLLARPDDPFARYLREKYPEGWALATGNIKEAADAENEGGKL